MTTNAMLVIDVDITTINSMMDEINADRTVPKNIRISMQKAKDGLNNEKHDLPIRINSAISILDEVSNDPNIPIYTRTHIWNIVSMLEVINEESKTEKIE